MYFIDVVSLENSKILFLNNITSILEESIEVFSISSLFETIVFSVRSISRMIFYFNNRLGFHKLVLLFLEDIVCGKCILLIPKNYVIF